MKHRNIQAAIAASERNDVSQRMPEMRQTPSLQEC